MVTGVNWGQDILYQMKLRMHSRKGAGVHWRQDNIPYQMKPHIPAARGLAFTG